MADVKNGNYGPIPRQLQNKHYDGEDAEVKGQFYIYPHDYPNHCTYQQYLPDKIKIRNITNLALIKMNRRSNLIGIR